jgi:hypothetical protein
MTNVLTARAKRPALSNTEYFSRRARARAQLGRAADAAADVTIAANTLTDAPVKDIEIKDLFIHASSWANLAAAHRALGHTREFAEALARRKDLFSEIRLRGFRSEYINQLENQP